MLNAKSLLQKAESYGLKGKKYANVNAALKEVNAKAAKDDLIIVCGSVFLVGEVEGV